MFIWEVVHFADLPTRNASSVSDNHVWLWTKVISHFLLQPTLLLTCKDAFSCAHRVSYQEPQTAHPSNKDGGAWKKDDSCSRRSQTSGSGGPRSNPKLSPLCCKLVNLLHLLSALVCSFVKWRSNFPIKVSLHLCPFLWLTLLIFEDWTQRNTLSTFHLSLGP